jgi:hypothetical protein
MNTKTCCVMLCSVPRNRSTLSSTCTLCRVARTATGTATTLPSKSLTPASRDPSPRLRKLHALACRGPDCPASGGPRCLSFACLAANGQSSPRLSGPRKISSVPTSSLLPRYGHILESTGLELNLCRRHVSLSPLPHLAGTLLQYMPER